MTKPESVILREQLLLLSKLGVRAWRNNVGRVHGDDGRVHAFGLAKGNSDIIGLTNTGRFLAVEVKAERGRSSPEQRAFIAMVRAMGGLAGISRCDDDTLAILAGGIRD